MTVMSETKTREEMPEFRVWVPGDGVRPEKPNVVAWDEESAATQFVESHHADLDHCATCEVRVDDQAGHRFFFTVEVHSELTFRVANHD